MNEKPNETLAAWETSSQYWNKYQTIIAQMFAPLTRALIEAAAIAPGQTVLDIGGGSGEPSLTIAKLIAPKGSVSYTDPSAGMVQSARDAAQRRNLTNIEFHQASAEKLPFSSASFDVAVSRLSAMFFSDMSAGLREVLRVVKPNGAAVFLVWAEREANPFFSVVTEVLDQFVPAEPEDEDAPGAFRFAPPGKLAKLLKEVGATSIGEQAVDFNIEAPVNIEQFWDLRTEMSDTFRNKLAKLEPSKVELLRQAVIDAAKPYFKTGAMSFPGRARIVECKKAG